ncbi:conserved unknown protein [Ectocarpus siliculosus]|uniref:Thioredoxin domain-containing protein n=1 Tax=Ectocarpus siliculosus TaxID=2880 RepID=D7FUB8_ECTSI|nr:conserved unknown protein [Ectocarpus siliculosus]|eukprot:CBJ26188.1 conserved unknown protein [Ectocarpus siliculosus]
MARSAAYVLAATAIVSSTTAFVPMGGARLSSAPQATAERRSATCRRGRQTDAAAAVAPLSMAIRAVESFNADFELEEKTAATLDGYLRHKDMIAEVCKQFDCESAEYVGEIFQPVPYSQATPQGMPKDIEEKFFLNEQYGIANIPPVVMFNAKIFKPSRLCAVYKVDGLSEDAKAVLNERILRLRENEKRKKEEAELETPWDDIGSAFTEVHNMPVGSDDDDVDLDSMVV